MNILDPQINQYLNDHLPGRDPILLEMEQLAIEREFPIVGPLVGQLCFLIVKAISARRILELGSGFGYSAFWLAIALPDNGKIFCTELAADYLKLAKGFFQRGGLNHKVEFYQGNALELIQQFDGPFDIIFNDVDKGDYPRALELITPKLRSGGILISDNMLWHGRVVQEDPGPDTQGILTYTEKVYQSNSLWTSIIPLRDGVGISLKL